MTKDEALQLALDSMKEIIHWYAVRDRNDVFLNFVDQNPEIQKIMKSITAIKEALETKDEQRTWVGLTELDCVGWFGYDTGLRLWFETNKGDDGAIPLYKDQPQRTWVGLKDDERKTICNLADADDWHDFQVMDATEAKLKEKNGY